MFDCFFPDEIQESSYAIDYRQLYDEGVRGLIYDIDNTLVEHGAPADERAKKLFNDLKEIGFKAVIISNNKEKRVKSFSDDVGVPSFYDVGKPSKKGYMDAVNLMGIDVKSAVFIGDQLFTDIWGAKRCGIRNILVKPIDPHEEIQIVLKRRLEAIVLFFYNKKINNKCGEI